MLTRTSSFAGRPAFIKDHFSVLRTGGAQVDWANVDVAYVDPVTGKKHLQAGTVVGTLLGAGKISPRAETTNPATGVLETDAVEDSLTDSLSGYGVIVGGTLYENLMPDSSGGPPATLDADVKTELQANCPRGFHFITYQDTR